MRSRSVPGLLSLGGGALLALALAAGGTRAQELPPRLPAPEPGPDEEPEITAPEGPQRLQNLGTRGPGPGGPGMGGPGMVGGPGGSGGPGGPGYGVTWYPSGRAESPARGHLTVVRQSASAMAPVWAEGPNTVMLTAGVSESHFAGNVVRPESGRAFPSDLWNVNIGANYFRRFDNGWTAGAMVGVGSSSDKPFNSLREITPTVMAFLAVPARNDRDNWRLSLMYSPVGLLNFPLPGVSYEWHPSDQLTVNIGLPFSLTWRPTDRWNLSLSYMFPSTASARAGYQLTPEVLVYAAYGWYNDGYFLADRADSRDRFLGLEQRVFGGVTVSRWERLSADLSAGFAFDRRYGTGRTQGTNLRDEVRLAPGGFAGVSLRYRF